MTEKCSICGAPYRPQPGSNTCPQCGPQGTHQNYWGQIEDDWEKTFDPSNATPLAGNAVAAESDKDHHALNGGTQDLESGGERLEGDNARPPSLPSRAKKTRSRAKGRKKNWATGPSPAPSPLRAKEKQRRQSPSAPTPKLSKKKSSPPWLLPILVFFGVVLILLLALMATKGK